MSKESANLFPVQPVPEGHTFAVGGVPSASGALPPSMQREHACTTNTERVGMVYEFNMYYAECTRCAWYSGNFEDPRRARQGVRDHLKLLHGIEDGEIGRG